MAEKKKENPRCTTSIFSYTCTFVPYLVSTYVTPSQYLIYSPFLYLKDGQRQIQIDTPYGQSEKKKEKDRNNTARGACSASTYIISVAALDKHSISSSPLGIKSNETLNTYLFLYFLLSKCMPRTLHSEAKRTVDASHSNTSTQADHTQIHSLTCCSRKRTS